MKNKKDEKPNKPKAKYESPKIRTESLTAVAALCNGTANGGRKAAVAGGCVAARLKS
jgi:hypothetical protein